MFTGIVEERGSVKKITRSGSGYSLEISAEKILEDIKLGDSISTNGVCLTVSGLTGNGFTADCMKQTLNMTNFSELKSGDFVNLERALAVGERLGGHFVSGHIDGIGVVKAIKKTQNDTVVRIEVDKSLIKNIISQGSIAVDGVSLTVSKLLDGAFEVSLIPTTLKDSGLGDLKVGSSVNIETDMLGKYVANIVTTPGLTKEFLFENGF